jgi:two-component system nitrogen regulation sensor histidine kinase NtrY
MMLLTGIAFTFPVFYYCELQINPVLFYLFLISVVLIIDVYSELKEQKLTYLLWWILMFSGYLAIGFFHYDQLKSGQAREEFLDSHFASSSPADVASAARIKEVLDTSNIFLQLGNLEYPAKWDKDEIKGLFGGLLKISPEQFDIELFDDNGFSLFANHFGNYHQIKKSLQLAHTEEGNNLFFHPIHQGYYLRYEILPEKHPEGPWLFVLSYGNKTSGEFDTQNLSYALLKRGYLVEKQFQANDMPSDQELMQVKGNGIQGRFQYTTRENNMGYTMLVFEDKPGLLKPISIFSFLFALTGILMIILTWINTGKPFLPEILPLKMGTKSSLKTKIQLSIILLIIFSFIVVGSVTAFYFYNLIQANQNSKEREETQILANSVIRESRDKENPEELIAYFYKNLLNLSYVHGKSLQLYDAQGKLLATSKSEPSEYIIPYYKATGNKISAGRNVKNTEENHFDYITLIDNNDQKAGYLGIQHHYTNISMKSIIDFLGTILNVYIFLFLIAGVIAITIANSITQPIAILAEKLKQFKLGRTNEYLEWQSNDEIGTLITEYNNLNEALTRSAEMLAKTERDMAWREMAKQVAHEIKNPLTPMKLSIQYLEKAAKEDPERAKDMIPRVSNTLIEQIDNLSQIAVEFSNFASMPQANNEKVALNELVVTIHDLFRKRDDMDVTLSTPIDDLVVFADKNHLVRILNNLVKNAIQAIPDDRRGKIDISLYQENNHAVVRVTDNGSGIPESMKSKVFAPNFTTKSSGTGLGLAISANMIESFNGKIYFESEENKGTRFYIRIPLMRKEEGRGDLRVSLDE